MAEQDRPTADAPRPGDRRGNDRRGSERRALERRAPAPMWRRPWALVLYGVLGTLVVVLFFNRSRPAAVPVGGQEQEDRVVTLAPGAPAPGEINAAPPSGTPEDARRTADHQRLMAEGEAARGRLLNVELYCGSISSVSLRSVERIESAIASVADISNRVPAAECRWGAPTGDAPSGDARRAEVWILVPPELAESFAVAPVVDDGFVQRRRILGVAEWVGRSEAMALRTVLVLRQYPAGAGQAS